MMKSGKNSKGQRKYWFFYTLLFAGLAGIVFQYFWRNERTLIWAGGGMDGWAQHYTALVYYARWMRSILKAFWETHTLSIPTWSFRIGYGADILTTLHYYVIGDPLDVFAVLVPTRYMMYFYSGLIVLRLYLAGAGFSLFCFEKGACKSHLGVLAGALAYCFCGFALYAAVRHPYFSNPMIYLPLLLLGVEKVLQKQKPGLFIIMVFISAISNFYFFYMLVLLTVLYAAVVMILRFAEAVQAGEDWKDALWGQIWMAMQFIGYAVIGVMLSAVILLPVLYLFFHDPRMSSGYTWHFLYPGNYYRSFLASFLTVDSPGYWNFMGYSGCSLLAVVLLFGKKKQHYGLKAGFLLLTAGLLLPVAGHIFNGFSYVTNRWNWGYAMLNSYILVAMWQDLFSLSKKEKRMLGAVAGMYGIICWFWQKEDITNFAVEAVLLFGCLVVLLCQTEGAKKTLESMGFQCILLCLILSGSGVNAYFLYSEEQKNYQQDFKPFDEVNESLYGAETEVIKEAAGEDDSFFRYSGTVITKNATLLSGLSSTQYFWSLSNGAVANLFEQADLSERLVFNYKELDNRAALNALAGVRYYLTGTRAKAPYGYEKAQVQKEDSAFILYENTLSLPFGYTYTSYLLPEQIQAQNGLGLQEAMLQGVLLEEKLDGYSLCEPALTAEQIPYMVLPQSDTVSLQDHCFVVTQRNARVTLEFDGRDDCETYFYIKGLDYRGVSEKALYFETEEFDPLDLYDEAGWNRLSASRKKSLTDREQDWEEVDRVDLVLNGEAQMAGWEKNLRYYTSYYSWYENRHDFLVHMGYSQNGQTSVTITFPEIGRYSFTDLQIFCQPMDAYEGQIDGLRSEVLEHVDLHEDSAAYATNEVTGTISLESDKILCLSIPYTEGWTAYVDGEEQPLLRANVMYFALPLSAGAHEIRLVYHTPGVRAGVAVTLAGLLCLAGLYGYRVLKKKTDRSLS